jgi:hypothetical protein
MRCLSMKRAIIICFCCLQACPSMAICPFPKRRIRTQFTRSDVVFIGRILSERGINSAGKEVIDPIELDPFGEAEVLCYRVHAEQIFRGTKNDEFEICEGNDSSRMGLRVGQAYLLLIEKNENGILFGSCFDAINTRDPDYKNKISEVKAVIQNIKAKSDGDILGFVGSTEGNVSDGLADIHFLLKGVGINRIVISDKSGWFHVRVPAGLYKIEPIEPSYHIERTIYSPDNPDHIDVRVAGGGEVSFVATPKN